MTTVHKHPVELRDEFVLLLPEGAEFLCVQNRHGTAQMWFRVDMSRPARYQKFFVVGTGNPMGREASVAPYKGTFQIEGGGLVFHLFGGVYA